jgi:hypothetical protein
MTLWLALTVAACSRSAERAPDANAAISVVPTIDRVTPMQVLMTGNAPVTLDIAGTGFEDSTNTVVLGPARLSDVRSQANGTRILFTVPDRVPSGGGAAPMLWISGRYALTVTTARGTSNSISIDVEEKR